MPAPKCTDEEFIDTWNRLGGNGEAVAKAVGSDVRNAMRRRRSIEKRYSMVLTAVESPDRVVTDTLPRQGIRAVEDVRNVVMVGSDCHYWPGAASVAHKAFVELVKGLKPSPVTAGLEARA